MTAQENPGGWPGPAGLPLNPATEGWHWLRWPKTQKLYAFRWTPSYPGFGHWSGLLADGSAGSALDAVHQGWVYEEPCHLPTNVAALVEAARAEAMREAAATHCRDRLYSWTVLGGPEPAETFYADFGRRDAARQIQEAIRALPVPTTTQRAGGEP